MKSAGHLQKRIFPVFHSWDEQAKFLRNAPVPGRPDELQNTQIHLLCAPIVVIVAITLKTVQKQVGHSKRSPADTAEQRYCVLKKECVVVR